MKNISALIKHFQDLIVTMQNNPIGAVFAVIMVYFVSQYGRLGLW